MRVAIDLDLCCGYGNCVFHSDEVFELDDEAGVARLLTHEVGASDQQKVRDAAADCPVSAITVTE